MSGLVYVSARPFAVHAQSTAVSALKNLANRKQGKLRFYDVWQRESPEPLSGLALAHVNDPSTFKLKATSLLQSLPKLPRDTIMNGAAVRANFAEAINAPRRARRKQCLESLIDPDPQDDGIPLDGDYDPDLVICDGEDMGDEEDTKNNPDFDPDQDPEAEFYTEHVDAWMKADIEECVRGTKPRLYHHLMDSNAYAGYSHPPDLESSGSLDPTLSPYLFIHQIRSWQDLTAQKEEEKSRDMVASYRYLTSVDGFRQVKLFRQEDPAFPRWLMVQLFTEDIVVDDITLKKEEAEYWWRKNGCDGVIVEFFRRRKIQ